MKKIFLVEDDKEIAKNLALLLRTEGFTVTNAYTLREACDLLEGNRFDLALVDIALPDGNGFAVCTQIRQSQDIPVIFLTASGDEASVVTGLNMGADDYVTKPFRPRELIARIGSALRKSGHAPSAFEIGNLHVDTASGIVRKDVWLVTSLLKLSRLDAKLAVFRKEQIPVDGLLRAAARPLLIPMELHDITLTADVPEDLKIWGDPEWLAEALRNVLKNCMESAGDGGLIKVVCEDNLLYAQITIRDSGPGFAREDLPHIFDRFYRGRAGNARGNAEEVGQDGAVDAGYGDGRGKGEGRGSAGGGGDAEGGSSAENGGDAKGRGSAGGYGIGLALCRCMTAAGMRRTDISSSGPRRPGGESQHAVRGGVHRHDIPDRRGQCVQYDLHQRQAAQERAGHAAVRGDVRPGFQPHDALRMCPLRASDLAVRSACGAAVLLGHLPGADRGRGDGGHALFAPLEEHDGQYPGGIPGDIRHRAVRCGEGETGKYHRGASGRYDLNGAYLCGS